MLPLLLTAVNEGKLTIEVGQNERCYLLMNDNEKSWKWISIFFPLQIRNFFKSGYGKAPHWKACSWHTDIQVFVLFLVRTQL